MSWSPLLPARPVAAAKARAAVTASASAGTGSHTPKLSLVFRPAMLEGVTWLVPGNGLQVMVGGGNHAGMLRIMPDGLHTLGKVALAKPAGSLVSLKLPMPPGMQAGKRPSVPCEFEYQEGWIEVTLPGADWAAVPAASPAKVATPAAVPRAVELAQQAAAEARRRAGA